MGDEQKQMIRACGALPNFALAFGSWTLSRTFPAFVSASEPATVEANLHPTAAACSVGSIGPSPAMYSRTGAGVQGAFGTTSP